MDLKKLTRYNIKQGKENGEEHSLGSWVKYPDVAILNHCELRGWEYGNLSMNQVVELPLFYEARGAVDLKKLDRYSWVGGPKKGFRGHWVKYEDLVIFLKGREGRWGGAKPLNDPGLSPGRPTSSIIPHPKTHILYPIEKFSLTNQYFNV